MIAKTIDKTIYTSSPEFIAKYQYNPLKGVVLTALSIVMLWANTNWEWFDMHERASEWNLLTASCLLCVGLTMICYRLFGDSSAPMDRRTRERLYREVFGFDMADYGKVKEAFENGDFERLRALPRCCHPMMQVVCYRTDSGSIMAAQMVCKEQPECDVRIFLEGEYAY